MRRCIEVRSIRSGLEDSRGSLGWRRVPQVKRRSRLRPPSNMVHCPNAKHVEKRGSPPGRSYGFGLGNQRSVPSSNKLGSRNAAPGGAACRRRLG